MRASSALTVRGKYSSSIALARPDQPLQREARAGVARQGDVGEGQVEAGGVGHDPQVAGEGQAGTGPGGHAVDRRDHRLLHPGDGGDDRVVVLVDGAEQRVGGAALEDLDVLLEVLSDAERATRAGQHDAPDGRVVGDLAHRGEQRLLGRDVEAVHRLGPVEGEGRDAVGDLEQDRGDVAVMPCRLFTGAASHTQAPGDEPVGGRLEPRRLAGEQVGRRLPGPVAGEQRRREPGVVEEELAPLVDQPEARGEGRLVLVARARPSRRARARRRRPATRRTTWRAPRGPTPRPGRAPARPRRRAAPARRRGRPPRRPRAGRTGTATRPARARRTRGSGAPRAAAPAPPRSRGRSTKTSRHRPSQGSGSER